jgi:hypothetical protein
MSWFRETECRHCGSKDHASDDCPHEHGFLGIGAETECRHCGSKEHSSDDCPHDHGFFGIGEETECRHCGSHDHASDDCPHDHGFFGIGEETKCRYCGSRNHSSDDCPHDHGFFGIGAETKCRHCGSKQHSSDDCPHGRTRDRIDDDCDESSRSYNPSYESESSASDSSSSSSSESDQSSFLGQLFGWALIIGVVYLLVMGVRGSSDNSHSSFTQFPTEVVSTPGLNLRSDPDRTSNVLVTLTQGEAVQVMGTATSRTGAEWAHVRARGMEGWVTREYLSGAPARAPVVPGASGEPSSPTRTRITLQYQLPRDADNLAAIRTALKEHSDWRVGHAERVLPAGENKPETYAGVRFFFESDSVLARTVCEAVVADLGRQGYSVTLPIWPMLTRQRLGLFHARPGLIEVWVDPLPDSPAPPEQRPLSGQCGR